MENKYNYLLQIILGFSAGLMVYLFLPTLKHSASDKNNSTGTNVVQNTVNTSDNIAKNASLNYSGKGLTKLPAEILNRTDLQELNISNNSITGALPSEIGKLKKLKVLNASNNQMTGVPAEIGQLTDLEVLDLSNNNLTGLPNELANLKKLRIFNISGNDYSQLDLDIIKTGLPSDVKIVQ